MHCSLHLLEVLCAHSQVLFTNMRCSVDCWSLTIRLMTTLSLQGRCWVPEISAEAAALYGNMSCDRSVLQSLQPTELRVDTTLTEPYTYLMSAGAYTPLTVSPIRTGLALDVYSNYVSAQGTKVLAINLSTS